MRQEAAHPLSTALGSRPSTQAIVDAVVAVWPEHAAYLAKSFGIRTPAMLDVAEIAAAAVLQLVGGSLTDSARAYRWTCDRLREEELFFHREGRYRLSSFTEASAEVYSNTDYMAKYMSGLLLTQVLWYNHCATFEMFLRSALRAQRSGFDYLEVGPGHGLMVYLAARNPLCNRLEAWDVSPVSIEDTRAALKKLAIDKPIELVVADIVKMEVPDRQFDLIVISEVLEHLERPTDALKTLRGALRPTGQVFINVPLNSPSPDHLYLLSSPEEVERMVEEAGLRVAALELFATQGHNVAKALRTKISVSAGVLASLP